MERNGDDSHHITDTDLPKARPPWFKEKRRFLFAGLLSALSLSVAYFLWSVQTRIDEGVVVSDIEELDVVSKPLPAPPVKEDDLKLPRSQAADLSDLGLLGTGRGGGGTGEGTIGLGNLSTIGHGGGGGSGSGYGRGAGGLGKRHYGLKGPSSRQPYAFLNNPTAVHVPGHNTEAYDHLEETPFLKVSSSPLSTFSIDVDTASYANVRRYLNENTPPPKDAVRIEELVNYFDYAYPPPLGDAPFSVNIETAVCPWNRAHTLARIGLKGREIDNGNRPPSNLVFLIDVSGSMQPDNKLPLLKRAMTLMVNALDRRDNVAIVVYAGASGLVLPSTSGDRKETVREALENLEAGGATNGAAGIELAYDIAQTAFIKDGINRVILATDGDFNVGVTDNGSLVRLIEKRARGGVFLTVLGVGMGNLKDATLEKIADKGNGHFAYFDSLREAQKVLVDEMGATLFTIAKDVKLQVEFNPKKVGAYRLIGYENRVLAARDFNDDKKDAGEIGAGHTVTALYELTPPDPNDRPDVDPLKYQRTEQTDAASSSRERFTVKLRYKPPKEDKSRLLTYVAPADIDVDRTPSADFILAAAVAEFGMLLRNSPYKGNAGFDNVLKSAEQNLGEDHHGYRKELVTLIKKAEQIIGTQTARVGCTSAGCK